MKRVRLRHAKLIVALVVVANLILFYYSWKSTLWKSIASSLATPGNGNGRGISIGIGIEPYVVGQPQTQTRPQRNTPNAKASKERGRNAFKHIRKSMTIVFRSFFAFENDLKESIDSILDVVPNMPIVLLQDGVPYPPLTYERNSSAAKGEDGAATVRFVSLGFDVAKSAHELDPLAAIRTKYALFMPDSVRLTSKSLLQKLLREINTKPPTATASSSPRADEVVRRAIIVPFAGNLKSFAGCTQISLDLPNWTIQYAAVNSSSDKCDLYLQKHALLVDVGVLREMPDPLSAPFPEMFYIQAKLAKIPKTVFPQTLQDGRRLFAAYHTKQRRLELRRRQFRDMYKRLQIKRIIRRSHKVLPPADTRDGREAGDGGQGGDVRLGGPQHHLVLDTQFSSSNFSLPLVTEIELIGCERTTKSCVGTVYNQRPFYVYLGRHTPPCCRDKLKSTFNHVLEEFENVGIRYWLDNEALRAAIESNQLAPDAYDLDISFNVNDLERSNALKKSQSRPYVDNEGFYWIKATDGHYFRVQFSKINQIAVNLLPFQVVGNEVRASGFFGWKAKSFSADYLHPMSTVLFWGKNVMCPNNVREYLDFKAIP